MSMPAPTVRAPSQSLSYWDEQVREMLASPANDSELL